MKLYLGNKTYSSWSFRPWIGMRHAGIAFEEEVIPFDFEAGNPEIRKRSPSGKVPYLVDGELVIPESLAILDHVARKFPESGLWPADPIRRSRAMAMACEMHAGFQALRMHCSMNFRRSPAAIAPDEAVLGNVARIDALWREALAESGGPFLCGDFSIADAMFAPVVNRFDVYRLEVSEPARSYMGRIEALPAWQEWVAAARAETDRIPAYEV